MTKLNIAVIGSGISGLSAAWLLAKKHTVTIFEKADYVGGHANTVDVMTGDGLAPVDTGFIVFNDTNYPNLSALFRHLGVACDDTVMGFSLTCDDGRYEYSASGANGYFGQRSNIARIRHWMLLKEIARFFSEAKTRIGIYHRDTPLGEFLKCENYTQTFIEDHILPMGAAIWSSTTDDMLAFPAQSFIQFYDNHGMLQFKNRPLWRTVRGGSRNYIRRILEDSALDVRLGSDLKHIRRKGDCVTLETTDGVVHLFDHVVMATHPDQALGLLGDADAAEQALLSQFTYQENIAVLHRDPSWLPRRRRLWTSWNYLKSGGSGDLCVTYWMNQLQRLPTRENLFVTLNPTEQIDPDLVLRRFNYEHPVFDTEALRAQTKMASIQGQRRTWFCGSWLGYGFHEDGIASGLNVAEQLGGVARPWRRDQDYIRNAPSEQLELQVAE
ncbi:FAD-dependent oxidoreductase [Hoeflea sp. CAU 1731]